MTNQTQTPEAYAINSLRNKAVEARANEITNKHLAQSFAAAAAELEAIFGMAAPATNTTVPTAKCGTEAAMETPTKKGKKQAAAEADPFDLEPETTEEEPEEIEEETEEEPVGYTQDMVAKKFSDYAKKSEKHKTRAIKILKGLNAKSIKDLSPLKFKEAVNLLEKTANM